MSSYSELIKNFERIRSYMREFYVYGFKSREDYKKKSARSYDDERRRMESWLGDHMSFVRTPEGKNVFISIDSRETRHNPLYKAFCAKSFTDGDITLHFILFDILYGGCELTLTEITEKLDEYLSLFDEPLVFDESTVRKKLEEYSSLGIVKKEKRGKRTVYSRAAEEDISGLSDMLDFFSEVAPCGVIGSYLLEKCGSGNAFAFKHHYITGAIDSEVVADLFSAMRSKSSVTVSNLNRKHDEPLRCVLVPLRIFISVQSGRQHLLAYNPAAKGLVSYRIDYLSNVKINFPEPRFDELRDMLSEVQKKMWGVNIRRGKFGRENIEHVDFTVKISAGEEYIINRLLRERRIGRVERVDKFTYRFVADVYDSGEMIPWIRTFIGHITEMNFSNRTVENRFKGDLYKLYGMYGIDLPASSEVVSVAEKELSEVAK